MTRIPSGTPLDERIRLSTDIVDGHWLWNKAANCGYGVMRVQTPEGPKNIMAHRAAFEAFVRPLEPGEEVLHATGCPRRCCNPEHLSAGTHAENMAQYAQGNTHCRRGHAYADHARVRKDGKRVCSECIKISRARERLKHT